MLFVDQVTPKQVFFRSVSTQLLPRRGIGMVTLNLRTGLDVTPQNFVPTAKLFGLDFSKMSCVSAKTCVIGIITSNIGGANV